MINQKKRIFAIYLPQFHPLQENDLFWGKGFTEWHNVAAAKPLFNGHYQPQLPTELGFYDLRVPETLQEQSKLAMDYGINGFLFYHYWFNGNPVMNKPLDIYLQLKEYKLPYFFCWANENWTRRWDGGDTEILLKQDYNEKDNEQHIHYLSKFFEDEKYLKIDNCPVLAIYRPSHIPHLRKWVQNIRNICSQLGYQGIYLIYVINQGLDMEVNVSDKGFDAGLIFEPSWKEVNEAAYKVRLSDKFGKLLHLLRLKKELPFVYKHSRIDYEKYVSNRIANTISYSFKCYQSVFPGWDNSPRRKKGVQTFLLKVIRTILKSG